MNSIGLSLKIIGRKKVTEKKITENVFAIPFTRDEIFSIVYLIADFNSLKAQVPEEDHGLSREFTLDSVTNRFGGYFQALLKDDPELLAIAKEMHVGTTLVDKN